MNREAIYSALWTQLQSAAGFATVSRRPILPDELANVEQPALAMEELPEEALQPPDGTGGKRLLHVNLAVYCLRPAGPLASFESDDGTDAPTTQLNDLLDAVEACLAPPVYAKYQDLGIPLLIQHAWIEGTIEKNPGYLSAQCAAVVPVHILAYP